MKYVIVGGNTGGLGAAARLRRLDEKAEISVFEKGAFVSYSNCSLPYRLSDTVDCDEKLVLNTPQSLKASYNIDVRVLSEVTAIDRKAKRVAVKRADGSKYFESYDKLILATGASAVIPPIKGIEGANLFTLKTVEDASRLYAFLRQNDIKNVTVIGGGFIGVEAAVNLKEAGYNVALIEALPQILNTFDYDMVQILQKEMLDKEVNLIVGDSVASFEGSAAVLKSGTKVPAGAVIMAAGVRAESRLAAEASLELNARGAIVTDANYRTSDPDIYAVGDAAEVFNALTHKKFTLQLAGPAQKQARQAADSICGRTVRNTGFIGSSSIKVFGLSAASTGLTAAQCEREGISYDVSYVLPQDRVSIMPGSRMLHYKLIFEVPTGRILGVQAISAGEAVKRADVAAALIKTGGTVDDLRDLELCYAPPFSSAKDPANYAGLVACNLLNGEYRQVRVDKVRELVKAGAYILDVRPAAAFARGHVKTAVNIPMSVLRERLNEIPKDRPVYVHCRIGQTSYNAVRALQGNGFTNVYNVSGGFAGICYYEYFNDVTLKREPIVTDYVF